MNIKKTLMKLMLVLVGSLASMHAANAISVYADFNGDAVYDPVYDALPGQTVIASIYLSQSAAEVSANGGITGFGVDMLTGGMPVLGNDIGNIQVDPIWNFAGSVSISDPTLASVRVVGNTLTAGGITDTTVHLFDVSLVVPDQPGDVFSLLFADIPGDTFVSNNFFVYDDMVNFAGSDVNAVPLPAAVWLMMSGLLAMVGIGRTNRKA